MVISLAASTGWVRGIGARDRRGLRGRGDRDRRRLARPADCSAGEDGGAGRRRRPCADVRAGRHRPDQRLGRADPARGARAAEGRGGQRTLAASVDALWSVALVIGLVAALAVAALLVLLIRAVRDIDSS